MDNQQIKILLYLREEKIGHLNIISIYPSNCAGSSFKNSLGTFSNVEKSEKPDDTSPIQCCNLGNGHSIMLLEETQYQITFIPLKSFDSIEIIPTIQESNSAVYAPFKLSSGDLVGTLNFGSYAGRSYFDVEIDGERSKPVPFEVRSKKINYQEHYTHMIVDMAKAVSGILFHQNAPLFQIFDFGDELRNTHYEDYMFLEYLFLDENLPYAYEYVRKNVYVNLEEHVETVPTSFASNLGHSGTVNIICSPEYLHKSKNPPVNWPNSMKNFVPESISQSFYEDSVDTPENRLLKYFLESIDTMVDSLIENLGEDSYIKERILLFDEKIEEYLSDKWLEDVGKLQIVPMNSQVLQKKEGYRNIFKYYLNFEFGFRPQWEEIEDLIKGYDRKLHELYEFWCYIQLLKIMEKLSGQKLVYEDIFELKSDNWEIAPKVGLKSKQTFNLSIENEEIQVNLFYNNTFNKNNNYKSYSLELRPDYTIEIVLSGKKCFIHFDAKYKSRGIPKDEDAYKTHIYKKEDVYKMHTYKDAIPDSLGSYVLYPGDYPTIFKEGNEIIPSVGAFPLTPGNNSEQESKLMKNIDKFLKVAIRRLKKLEKRITATNEPNELEKQAKSEIKLSDRELKYKKFWTALIEKYIQIYPKYKFGRNYPTRSYCTMSYAGTNIEYTIRFRKGSVSITLYCRHNSKPNSHELIEGITCRKSEIEDKLGLKMEIEENGKSAYVEIKYSKDVDILAISEKEKEDSINWIIEWLPKFKKVLNPIVTEIN